MRSGSTPLRYSVVRGVPSAPRQGAAPLRLLALIAATIVAIGALVVLAVPVFIGALLAAWAVRTWRGLRAPNGVLDGRRNVRVVVRD